MPALLFPLHYRPTTLRLLSILSEDVHAGMNHRVTVGSLLPYAVQVGTEANNASASVGISWRIVGFLLPATHFR